MAAQAGELVADPEAIRSFLRDSVQDNIHLIAITPDGPISARWFGDDVDGAVQWAEYENMRGRGIYWSVNAVVHGFNGKPTKKDIAFARFWHDDIDPPKDGGAFDKDGMIERLEAMRYPPSFILDTGGGLGGFWRMSETSLAFDQVEKTNLALAQMFDADCSSSEHSAQLAA